jgi:hypothetical protein
MSRIDLEEELRNVVAGIQLEGVLSKEDGRGLSVCFRTHGEYCGFPSPRVGYGMRDLVVLMLTVPGVGDCVVLNKVQAVDRVTGVSWQVKEVRHGR